MNFALILVVLSAISGFISLLDVAFWAKNDPPIKNQDASSNIHDLFSLCFLLCCCYALF